MGGRPSKGTSKDMRLAANKPTGKSSQSKPNKAQPMKKISTD
jgi:hypothetical protein